MHREGSTHTITPGPDELPARGESLPDEDALTPKRLTPVFSEADPNPNKTRLRPSGIAARAEDSAIPGQAFPAEIPTRLEERALDRGTSGGRMAAFEDHLRRNRADITASCRSCAVKEDKVA
jgi:hypothetical protein